MLLRNIIDKIPLKTLSFLLCINHIRTCRRDDMQSSNPHIKEAALKQAQIQHGCRSQHNQFAMSGRPECLAKLMAEGMAQ